jgi:hypothetical protein
MFGMPIRVVIIDTGTPSNSPAGNRQRRKLSQAPLARWLCSTCMHATAGGLPLLIRQLKPEIRQSLHEALPGLLQLEAGWISTGTARLTDLAKLLQSKNEGQSHTCDCEEPSARQMLELLPLSTLEIVSD